MTNANNIQTRLTAQKESIENDLKPLADTLHEVGEAVEAKTVSHMWSSEGEMGDFSVQSLNYDLKRLKNLLEDNSRRTDDRKKLALVLAECATAIPATTAEPGKKVEEAVRKAFPFNTGNSSGYTNSHQWLADLLGVKTYRKCYSAPGGWDAEVACIQPGVIAEKLAPVIAVLRDEGARKSALGQIWAERDQIIAKHVEGAVDNTYILGHIGDIKEQLQQGLDAIAAYEGKIGIMPKAGKHTSAIQSRKIKATKAEQHIA